MGNSAAQIFDSLLQSLQGTDAYDWKRHARSNQLPPVGDWRVWLLLAGRGFGKTRTICEFVRGEIEAKRAARVALIGATAADVRDVLVEGPAGILAISPDYARPQYEPSKRRLTWPNGAIATAFTADEPDRLRGPQHDLAACDELAAWKDPAAWDMLQMGLRLGKNPRCAVATTPRPGKLLRDLLAREGHDVAVTRGKTVDNRDNLAPQFMDTIIARYQGTRLGRQELDGEMLNDVPGALWTLDNLDATRVAAPPLMKRIVVAVDPAGSTSEGADETGIIAAGIGIDGDGYVLGDFSGRYAPAEWAQKALSIFHTLGADRIVIEKNFGGDMVAATLRSIEPHIPITEVTSSRGKILRAEPVSALFEQRRAHLVGNLPELEAQMTQFTSDWSRARDGSPDRVDALVFAVTEIMLNTAATEWSFMSIPRTR